MSRNVQHDQRLGSDAGPKIRYSVLSGRATAITDMDVADRVLDVLVPEILLDGPRIVAIVGEFGRC